MSEPLPGKSNSPLPPLDYRSSERRRQPTFADQILPFTFGFLSAGGFVYLALCAAKERGLSGYIASLGFGMIVSGVLWTNHKVRPTALGLAVGNVIGGLLTPVVLILNAGLC